MLAVGVQRRGEGDADDQALGGDESGDGLTPGLFARLVQQLKPAILELLGRGLNCRGIRHFELDRGLRPGPVSRPLRLSQAGLGGFGERPDAEVLGARHALGMPIIGVPGGRERKSERIDVELAAFCRVGGDDRDSGDENDVHATI